jgi:hypothetical protein
VDDARAQRDHGALSREAFRVDDTEAMVRLIHVRLSSATSLPSPRRPVATPLSKFPPNLTLLASLEIKIGSDLIREGAMKILMFALAIAVETGLIVTRAQARNYPWCAYYSAEDASVSCGFVSFEQCLTTVRGIGGICMRNTQYTPYALRTRSARQTDAQPITERQKGRKSYEAAPLLNHAATRPNASTRAASTAPTQAAPLVNHAATRPNAPTRAASTAPTQAAPLVNHAATRPNAPTRAASTAPTQAAPLVDHAATRPNAPTRAASTAPTQAAPLVNHAATRPNAPTRAAWAAPTHTKPVAPPVRAGGAPTPPEAAHTPHAGIKDTPHNTDVMKILNDDLVRFSTPEEQPQR